MIRACILAALPIGPTLGTERTVLSKIATETAWEIRLTVYIVAIDLKVNRVTWLFLGWVGTVSELARKSPFLGSC